MSSLGYFHMVRSMRALQPPPPSPFAQPELDPATLLSNVRYSRHHGRVTAVTGVTGHRPLATIEISTFVQQTLALTFNLPQQQTGGIDDADASAADAAPHDPDSQATNPQHNPLPDGNHDAPAAAPAVAADLPYRHATPLRVPDELLDIIQHNAHAIFISSSSAIQPLTADALAAVGTPPPAFHDYLAAADHALQLLSQRPLSDLTPELDEQLRGLADTLQLSAVQTCLCTWMDAACKISNAQGKHVLTGSLVTAAADTHMHKTLRRALSSAMDRPSLRRCLDDARDAWLRPDISRAACRMAQAWRRVRRALPAVIEHEITGNFRLLHAYLAEHQAAADPGVCHRATERIQAAVQHARRVVRRLSTLAPPDGAAPAAASAASRECSLPCMMRRLPQRAAGAELLGDIVSSARVFHAGNASETGTVLASGPDRTLFTYLEAAEQALGPFLLPQQQPLPEPHDAAAAATACSPEAAAAAGHRLPVNAAALLRLQLLADPVEVNEAVACLSAWLDAACRVSSAQGDQARLSGSLAVTGTNEHMHRTYQGEVDRVRFPSFQTWAMRMARWVAGAPPPARVDQAVCELAICWRQLGDALRGVLEKEIGGGFRALHGYLVKGGAAASPEACRETAEHIQAAVHRLRNAVRSLSGAMPAAAT